VVCPGGEDVRPADRKVFIHCSDGMGRSKLKRPLANAGTGRNLITVRKLAETARALTKQ